MKILPILCAALALTPLTACAGHLATVNSVSRQTLTSADALYTAASITGDNLVNLGVISRAAYQALDNKAYAILLQVRAGKATITDLSAATSALTKGG